MRVRSSSIVFGAFALGLTISVGASVVVDVGCGVGVAVGRGVGVCVATGAGALTLRSRCGLCARTPGAVNEPKVSARSRRVVMKGDVRFFLIIINGSPEF